MTVPNGHPNFMVRQVQRPYYEASQADGTTCLLPPAGPKAQGWTGKCKSSHYQSLVEVGIHSPAVGQARPSTLGPSGEGRSDSGCSTFTRGAQPATRRVADGESIPRERWRVRANTGDDEYQSDEQGFDVGLQLSLTMSTEISTADVVSRFSSQCVVSLSSGQPTPGPYSVATPSRWSVIVPCSM
jgi:hypothetical protein